MSDLREALSNLLNCVDGQHDHEWLQRCKDDARAALAQPEAVEPVAYLHQTEWGDKSVSFEPAKNHLQWKDTPLYTTPPLAPDERMRRALENIEYATRKDSLTDKERLQSVRTVVCAELSRAGDNHASEGKESEGGLNRQARNPVGLPDSSGDLASAGGIAGVDIKDHHRQVGSSAPSDPTPQAPR